VDFITNPTALLLVLPIAIIVFFLLRELLKGGGNSEFTSKLFSIKKVDNSAIMQKVDQLSKEVALLRAKIIYIENKDNLKFEYKSKLSKVVKKFYSHLIEGAEELLGRNTGFAPIVFRSLDEYKIMILTTDQLGHTITKKGMDDFDKNGFNKVGFDAEGVFDARIQTSYVNDKPDEYAIELKKILNGVERPTTVISLQNCVDETDPVDRKVLLPLDEYEICVMKSLKSIGVDITDLYDFIITRYRTIDNAYQVGLKS
jgi:hypothetical protein